LQKVKCVVVHKKKKEVYQLQYMLPSMELLPLTQRHSGSLWHMSSTNNNLPTYKDIVI
jgi:hypothetical protein